MVIYGAVHVGLDLSRSDVFSHWREMQREQPIVAPAGSPFRCAVNSLYCPGQSGTVNTKIREISRTSLSTRGITRSSANAVSI